MPKFFFQGAYQNGERRPRCCWLSASTTTRLPRALITSSPVAQASSKRETVMTCSRRPVAGLMFSLNAVCEERWKGVTAADWLFMSAIQLSCFSAVTESSFFCPKKAPLTSPQIEEGRGGEKKTAEKSIG